MKKFLCLTLLFASFASVSAEEDNPIMAIKRFYGVERVMRTQSFQDSAAFSKRLIGLYERCLTGSVLESISGFINSSAMHSRNLIFPEPPSKVNERIIDTISPNRVNVRYLINHENIFNSTSNFTLFGDQLTRIIDAYKVVGVSESELRSGLDTIRGDFSLIIHGSGEIKFSLNRSKDDSLWRISKLTPIIYDSSTVTIHIVPEDTADQALEILKQNSAIKFDN